MSSPDRPPRWTEVWGQRKMMILLFLGFSSGLPLFLTSRTLQAWMRVESVDLKTIGFFSLVGLPYSLKWLWAPLMDRYVPPFLGRRRGWMIIVQVPLAIAIGAMALHDPKTGLQMLALNAVIIAFLSASQDTVIDAYRTDVLSDRETGAGAAIWVLGYRIALLVTASLAFILADKLSWPLAYVLLAALMLIGIRTAFAAPEPVTKTEQPHTFAEAVTLPFKDFFQRRGVIGALSVLAFVVIYKFPDYLAGSIATPFLLDLKFSQTDIGAIQGGLGILATIIGALSGGALVARIGLARSLWVAGILQAVSNFAYYGLALMGHNYPFLVGAIVVENFCAGLVTAGFIGFMMSLCNPAFSATQFALLSGLMGASRDVLVAPAGGIAQATGWPVFFLITLAAAVPGLALLPVFAPWNRRT